MNRLNLLEHIEKFKYQLDNVAKLIEGGEENAIQELYASAKQARSRVTEKRKIGI